MYLHKPRRRQVIVSKDTADAIHRVRGDLSELEEVFRSDVELLATEA